MLPLSLTRVLRPALAMGLAASALSCGGTPEMAAMTSTQTFVGKVAGSDAFVGLVITGTNANLFFCGSGATLSAETHWIPGTVQPGQAFKFTDGVASATGTASSTLASGTFTPTPSAHPLSWSADVVSGETIAGVYDEQNQQGNAALIVLPPNGTAGSESQGAYLPPNPKGRIEQVTPYRKLALMGQSIEVTLPLGGCSIRLREQRRDLRRLQIAKCPLGRLFERHAQHLGALLGQQRFAVSDEQEEAPDRRQTAVSSLDRGFPFLFDVLQEREHFGAREILQAKNGYLLVVVRRHKAQKQAPCIAIRLDSPVGGASLFGKPLVEK